MSNFAKRRARRKNKDAVCRCCGQFQCEGLIEHSGSLFKVYYCKKQTGYWRSCTVRPVTACSMLNCEDHYIWTNMDFTPEEEDYVWSLFLKWVVFERSLFVPKPGSLLYLCCWSEYQQFKRNHRRRLVNVFCSTNAEFASLTQIRQYFTRTFERRQ